MQRCMCSDCRRHVPRLMPGCEGVVVADPDCALAATRLYGRCILACPGYAASATELQMRCVLACPGCA